ncbi:MAG: DUF1080 domain-containing protein [Planctomycetaceae bacterium]|nr:DUF1080 domain-containing protein [Planctomycetaceae bacterium]
MIQRHGLFVVAGLFLCVQAFAADPNAPTFTDPEQAGIDYEIQGEYVGHMPTSEGDIEIGVQIIALGDGKFRSVGLIGGLPGAGWRRGSEVRVFDGERVDNVAKFTVNDGDHRVEVDGKTLKVFVGNSVVAEFKKTNRQSPTLGAKPPAGAIVLFDGSSVEGWENGQLIEGDLLGATNCATKEKFGDHTLHVEFRTPFMPNSRGQARGNSGVYVQSRYEVQVLDSFGLEGKSNECGGIYSVSEPSTNMCLPPLAWQTYDIDFTAARYDDQGKKTKNGRITVKHNGVVIHNNVELTQGTPGRHPEGPESDALFLQDHGNPVAFRNIWIAPK